MARPLTQTAPHEMYGAGRYATPEGDAQGIGAMCCAPGRIRTCDTSFRRAVLYPLSYGGGDALEPRRETGPPPTV